jgi:lysophospholipase L1-like esterase
MLQRLLLGGFSILLTVGLLEVAVRVADSREAVADTAEPGLMEPALAMGWVPTRNAWRASVSASGDSFRLHINSTGQRGSELPPLTQPGVRLLFLGDSITFGAEVPEKDTFVKLVQDQLADHERQAISINGGVPGYSTYQELAYHRYVGQHLRPDVVVLAFFNGNDFRDNMIHTSSGEIVSPALLGAWRPTGNRAPVPGETLADPLSGTAATAASNRVLATLQRYSQLARLIIGRSDLLRARHQADLSRLDPSRYYFYEIGILQERVDPPFAMARDLTVLCLQRLHRDVRDAGAELLVVSIPSRNQVDPGAWAEVLDELGLDPADLGALNFDAPGQIIGDVCLALGVPLLDLTKAFRDNTDPASLYFGTHLSLDGHALAAERISAFLESRSERLRDIGLAQLHAGANALRAGDINQAEHELRELLEQRGPRVDALSLLAEARLQDSTSADLRAKLAEALLTAGDTVAAITNYVQAVRLRPAWWTYHDRLSDINASAGDQETSAEHAREARRLTRGDNNSRFGWREEHLQLGRALMQQEHWSRASVELRHAASFSRNAEDKAEIDYLLGIVSLSTDRLDSTTVHFSRIDPRSEWYEQATATLLAVSEIYAEAIIAAATQASVDSFVRLGALAVNGGKAEEIMLLCRQILAEHDAAQRVRLLYAVSLHTLGWYAESVSACRLVAADPLARMGMAQIQLARSLEALGRLDEARQAYETVVAADGTWQEGGAPARVARKRLAAL